MWEMHLYYSSGDSSEILKVYELESDIIVLPSCCSNYSRTTFATPPLIASVTFSRDVVGLISLNSSVVAASASDAIQSFNGSALGDGIT